MASKIPGVHIQSDPLDFPPSQRLRRFEKDLEQVLGDDVAEIKLINRYLDPDPKPDPRKGVFVSSAVQEGSRVAKSSVKHWTQSRTGYHDSAIADTDRISEWGASEIPIKPHYGTHVFRERKVQRRTPLQRVESMIQRYVETRKKFGSAFADGIFPEIAAEYWRKGMPVSTEDLRQAARKGLEEADRKVRLDHHKKSTKPAYVYR